MKAGVASLPCLDENTVAALVDGLLSPGALAAADAHVDECTDCRLLLSNLAPLLAPSSQAIPPHAPSHFTVSQTIEHDRIKWGASMRVGTVLRDKWRLERLLGVGGTAAVYEATHKTHGGRVAIKLIHAGLELDPGGRRRFLREGYAANAVDHPGIIRVIDDDVDESGCIFLVSELADGETAHARLGRLGRLPVEDVLALADDVLDILAAAHERGIVHRDIKPENILVAENGETMLLDFGMALVREATHESTVTTTHGLALGTPAFMPPEQALGLTEDIGPRTDIWALGATMFTLLSGRLVHDAATVTDAIRRTMKLPAPPLASVLPDAPAELCELVDVALAFASGDRWSTAREMQSATRATLDVIRQRPPEPIEADGHDSTTIAFYDAPPTRVDAKPRQKLLPVVGAAALVVIVIVGGWSSMRERSTPLERTELLSPTPTPTPTSEPAPVIELVPEASSEPATTAAPEPTARLIKPPPPLVAKPRPSSSSAPALGSSWLDRRTR